jgi:hypothetical protein
VRPSRWTKAARLASGTLLVSAILAAVPPAAHAETGWASEDCTAGTTLFDGYGPRVSSVTYHAYARLVVQPVDTTTTWVCVRVNDNLSGLGGRLTVTALAGATLGNPTVDSDATTCATQPANVLPGPHPIESGAVGDEPFLLDAYASSSEVSVCVLAGTVAQRIVIPISAGLVVPAVTFTPDPEGYHAPAPVIQPAHGSAACQATWGDTGRILNASFADTHVWLYRSASTNFDHQVCVRVEGATSAGGVLDLDVNNAAGLLQLMTVQDDTSPSTCTVNVLTLSTPDIQIGRTPTGVPAALCVRIGTQPLIRVGVAQPGTDYVTASWTPDA